MSGIPLGMEVEKVEIFINGKRIQILENLGRVKAILDFDQKELETLSEALTLLDSAATLMVKHDPSIIKLRDRIWKALYGKDATDVEGV